MFGQLDLRLDCIGSVAVEVDGLYLEQIAAQAWIDVVGIQRHDRLVSMNAPEVFLWADIDRDLIASDLEIPLAAYNVRYGFVYDNLVETWLIELDADFNFRKAGAKFSRGKRFQRAEFGPSLRVQSLVRSLQHPRPNCPVRPVRPYTRSRLPDNPVRQPGLHALRNLTGNRQLRSQRRIDRAPCRCVGENMNRRQFLKMAAAFGAWHPWNPGEAAANSQCIRGGFHGREAPVLTGQQAPSPKTTSPVTIHYLDEPGE